MTRPVETPDELAYRLHFDWWHKCRTCAHWPGDRTEALAKGNCGCEKSPFHKEEMAIDDGCAQWDTYDLDMAILVLDTPGGGYENAPPTGELHKDHPGWQRSNA